MGIVVIPTNLICCSTAVPFGKHAFFPGYLHHTNELMVGLGCGYRVECTASHTAGVLSRRRDAVERDISEVEAEIQGLKDRLRLAGSELKSVAGAAARGPSSSRSGANKHLSVIAEDNEQVVPGEGQREDIDAGQFEIRETYEESEELLRSARRPPVPSPAPPAPANAASASDVLRTDGQPGRGKALNSRDEDDVHLDRVFARMAELELLEAQQQEQEEEGQEGEGLSGRKQRQSQEEGGGEVAAGRRGTSPSAAIGDEEIREMFTPVPITSKSSIPPPLTQNTAGPAPSALPSSSNSASPLKGPEAPFVSPTSPKSALKKGFLVSSSSSSGKKKTLQSEPQALSISASSSFGAASVSVKPTVSGGSVKSSTISSTIDEVCAATGNASSISNRLPPARAFVGEVMERGEASNLDQATAGLISGSSTSHPSMTLAPGGEASGPAYSTSLPVTKVIAAGARPGSVSQGGEVSTSTSSSEAAAASGGSNAAVEPPQIEGKKVSKFKLQRAAARG